MKVMWEEADIRAGRIVRSLTEAKNRNYILCYTVVPDGTTWGITSLADGLVTTAPGYTREGLANYMNVVGFLPADDDREIVKAADVLRGCS